MEILKPKPLHEGGRIGVCAPAWYASHEELNLFKELWESLGYEIVFHPQVHARDGSVAGTGEQRASAFHELFQDDDIDAIISLIGGYGGIQMLEHLDFDLIRKNPKIIMGYSDMSILLSAVHAQTGMVTFHGPDIWCLYHRLNHPFTIQSMKDVLSGKTPTYNLPEWDMEQPDVIREGEATGILKGGNHVRMKDLTGTPYFPEMKDCLYFTESNRPMYPTLDTDMYNLRLSGSLVNPKAILFGSMEMVHTDNPKHQHIRYNLELKDVLPKHFPDEDVPLVTNLPFSHFRQEFITMPIGIPFHVAASHKEGVVIRQLEPAVAV